MRVFCIHGYMAPKAIMVPLARRLKRAGHEPVMFGYPSHRGTLEDHAEGLRALMQEHSDGPFSVIAHSMGGLVARLALQRMTCRASRCVFIATPHRGSANARRARQSHLARFMSPAVKRTAYGLETPPDVSNWGVIVGSRDRVVAPHEGRVDNVPARILPFGHNELLFRSETARTVIQFIERGAFEDPLDIL